MGSCFSKKKNSQKPTSNGHSSSKEQNYQPFKQEYQKPTSNYVQETHSCQPPPKQATPPPPAVPNPRPRPAMGSDPNTILGKPFEDIRRYYTLGKELGRGQYGVTYICTENATSHVYACKSIMKRNLINENQKEDIRREIQIMQHLSGRPNFVEFIETYEDTQSVHLVMELCAGGELFDRIVAAGNYNEKDAANICRHVVNVVHVCQFMGVMHWDLKPENLLFSSTEENSMLKETDFGLSVFIEEGKVYRNIVGSACYVAPEVLRRSYGKEIDIWSAGIILYILLSGLPPFWAETEKGIFDAILEGEIDFESDPWPKISRSAKDLVRKMLTQDPRKRITSAQVLEHPRLREGGEANTKLKQA